MQVISWLTCDFYLVVASGIQLSLRFCCSVQQVSHVLSLSFPNFNTEQPIHNLLPRQRRPGMLALDRVATGRRKDWLLGEVTHQRGPLATVAMGWQWRWVWRKRKRDPATGPSAFRMRLRVNWVLELAAAFPYHQPKNCGALLGVGLESCKPTAFPSRVDRSPSRKALVLGHSDFVTAPTKHSVTDGKGDCPLAVLWLAGHLIRRRHLVKGMSSSGPPWVVGWEERALKNNINYFQPFCDFF